jgi:hypothetical protein
MTFKFTRTFLLSALFSAFTIALTAQIEYGGEPYNWHQKAFERENLAFRTTGELDLETLRAEDAVTDQYKSAPYRFGYEWEVSWSPENSGTWQTLEDGSKLWQLGVACPEAVSISFEFSKFKLIDGARMFIWNEDRSAFKGSFTRENNKSYGTFGVGVLHDDFVVIELHVPAGTEDLNKVEIGKVVHGYRSILNHAEEMQEEYNRGPFGDSGNCNINVNCPEGDDWQIEKRSVALIVSGGFAICSGALVNNTAQDGTPYFLTANHCLGGDVGNWVFYFNHESASCSGSNGPTNQSVSGSVLRASNGGSDVALLELDETPPADYNVQYCGWDNSDVENVINTVGIHHPSGDVKKICFDNDAPYHTNQGGAAVWYIDEWEDGVTEGGSSGSPLFDQNHRIIGQLYGGFAACSGTVNNGQADWYGRFGVSWDGPSASSRLRDWLDPLNSGATILDGWPEGFVAANNDAGASNLSGFESTICGDLIVPEVTITNAGVETLVSVDIEVYLNGTLVTTIPWVGSLEQYQTETVVLPPLTLADGSNTIEVKVVNPNGVADENTNNDSVTTEVIAVAGPTLQYSLELVLDDFGSETTWEITNANNQVVYSGGPYQDGMDQTVENIELCIAEGCYTFTIFDSWGDGICCEYGEGSFTLYSDLGFGFASGGEFGESDAVDFCTQDLSVGEAGNANFAVYPNPANTQVTVEVSRSSDEVQLFNAVGQMVFSQRLTAEQRVVIPTSELPAGWYSVRVIGANEARTQQLMIQH